MDCGNLLDVEVVLILRLYMQLNNEGCALT